MDVIEEDNTYISGVVSSSKDEFWSTVVAGTDVRDVGLSLDQVFRTAKVAELKDSRFGIQ